MMPQPHKPSERQHDAKASGSSLRSRFASRKIPWLLHRVRVDQGLHKTAQERQEHLDAVFGFLQDEQNRALYQWIHQDLTIIDNKANTILSFDAIALLVLTFFYSSLTRDSLLFVKVGLIIAFVLLIWSIFPLARVAFVFQSTTDIFKVPQEMLKELLVIRDFRSRIVRLSVLKGASAFALFVVILIADSFTRLGPLISK